MLCTKRPGKEQQEALLGQVKVALFTGRHGWLRTVAKEAFSLDFASRSWIEENVHTLPPLKKKTSVSLHCDRDIRLKSNPNMEHRVENAATGDSTTDLVTEMEALLASIGDPALDYEDRIEPVVAAEKPVQPEMEAQPEVGVEAEPSVRSLDSPTVPAASGTKRVQDDDGSGAVKSAKRPREAEASSRPVQRRSVHPIRRNQPVRSHEVRNDEERCPVPCCTQEYQYPKAHVFNFHFPTKLDWNNEGRKATRDRLEALEYLACRLTGRRGASGWDLVDFINTRRLTEAHRFKGVDSWLGTVARQMEHQSRGRYAVPRRFSVYPLNSPALLFHWAVMQEVAASLEPTEYNAYMKLFSDPARSTELNQRFARFQLLQAPCTVSTVAAEEESGVQIQRRQETRPADLIIVRPNADSSVKPRVLVREEERASSPKKQCSAFDSHFHMDRLRKQTGVRTWSVEDVESCRRGAVPEVNLVGGVANFCDPATYPTVEIIRKLSEQGVEVTVGLHPKFAATVSPAALEHLSRLVALPEVAGVGEIGLDQTVKSKKFPMQRDVLAECLAMVQERHVLVLHCRESSQDTKSDLLASLFYQVSEMVPTEQRIHLHCFSGTTSDMRRWTRHFPNVYIGFTPMARSFGNEQVQAVRAVRKERLLLETDAPYFAPQGAQWSTPGCVGATGKAVAKLRGEAWEEVMSQSLENGHRLYHQ